MSPVAVKHTLRMTAAIAAAFACAMALNMATAKAAPIGAFTTTGAWSFVSAPKLHPPKLTLNTSRRGLAAGYFMTAVLKNLAVSKPMIGESGPLMLDDNLQPVWFNPIGVNALAASLRVQSYNHTQPVLTWWQGVVSPTGVTTSGEDVVVDQHYRHVATLKGADGWIISLHEMIISGGNAWVTAYKTVPMNLKPYGGAANGAVLDSAVQEYDLKTGQLLYTWDALNPGGTPNIPLSQSQYKPFPGIPWDPYHINSIQLTGNETFLVSMRNTWSAYLVSRTTNAIVWTLSGNPKISSFALPRNAQFHWQHDVQLHSGNVVSMFDDACCGLKALKNGKAVYDTHPYSPMRGLVLKLDLAKHTGTLVSQYTRGKGYISGRTAITAFLGNAQVLSGGNVVLGWGQQPWFSEVSRKGTVLLDAFWPGPDINYRTYVQKWVGTPFFPPSGAVRNNRGKATVYASWDGATQVMSWRVLAGSSANSLKAVASKPKTGFETTIPLTSSAKVYKVQALDSSHHVLGTSNAFPTSSSNSGLPGAY